MTTSLSLREYQTDAVQTLSDFLLAGERELALVSPTGSGKTVILTAILATCKRQLIGAVVTVPTETIEANYSNEAVFYLTPQDASDLGVSVVDGKLDARGTYVNVRGLPAERREIEFNAVLAGVDKSRTGWAFVATHSQLVKYSPKKLPADLTDRLLVVDEGHHAAEEATQIGEYAAAWRARGGTTLYLTATPYRSDGHTVLSSKVKVFTHSIAKHAASGYAPSDFRVKTAALGVEVDDIEGWNGETLPENEVSEGRGYEAILAQWEADGRPKAVFIVPGNRDSRSWAKRLIAALPAGVLAFDAVGAESSKADDLQELLEHERSVRQFSDSLVDVIVACKRFDEGTDWPLCSAVYCVGVPRSFGLVAQRWGRSFRDKSGIAGYPEEHRNVAQITFLLAKLTAKGLEKFKGDHHEYAMLLGVYLADHEIGRLVGRQWDRRDSKEGASGKSRRERVRDEQREVLDDRQCAEVQLRLVREAAQFEEAEGRARTPEEWGEAVDAIEDPVERREAGRVVARWLATGTGVGDEDRARLAGMLPGTGINPVYRELFREAIQGVGAVAVDIVGMVARVMSQFTGEDATGVVARIREAQIKRDMTWTTTEEAILEAATRWKEKYGKWPGKTGDARAVWDDPPLGVSLRWGSIDQWLFVGLRGLPGGSTLAQLCGKKLRPQNRHTRDTAWKTTEADVLEAAARWKEKHGVWPTLTERDGDARDFWRVVPPLGVSLRWRVVNQWLKRGLRGLPGGISLAQLLGKEKRQIGWVTTRGEIQAAAERWRVAYGEWPTPKSGGDVRSVWPEIPVGVAVSWMNIDDWLHKGRHGLDAGAGLPRLLGVSRRGWTTTREEVQNAAQKWEDKYGKWPTKRTAGDVREVWPEIPVGVAARWGAVEKWLNTGAHGLEARKGPLSLLRGQPRVVIREMVADPDFESALRRAVVAYRQEHTGRNPSSRVEDARAFLGFPSNWSGVDQAMKSVLGVSLHQWLVREGFVQ